MSREHCPVKTDVLRYRGSLIHCELEKDHIGPHKAFTDNDDIDVLDFSVLEDIEVNE